MVSLNKELKTRVVNAYSERISGKPKGQETRKNPSAELNVIQPESCCDDCCSSDSFDEDTREVMDKLDIQSFGCGNPVGLSSIVAGDVVVDLGSGAGLDCIIAGKKVGPAGRVVGIDMSDAMIAKAVENVAKLSLQDIVTFRKGDIEDLPVEDKFATMVISNCVIVLAPDKQRVFDEAFRILRQGGRMIVSDVVSDKDIPDELVRDEKLFVNCLSGATRVDRYFGMLHKSGFGTIEELERRTYGKLNHGQGGIELYSVTVRAVK